MIGALFQNSEISVHNSEATTGVPRQRTHVTHIGSSPRSMHVLDTVYGPSAELILGVPILVMHEEGFVSLCAHL